LTEYRLFLPGEAAPWTVQRARFANKNASPSVLRMRTFQDRIRAAFLAKYGRPDPPLTGPIALDLVFARGGGKHGRRKATSRPDITNLQKACEDALNDYAYRDDCQVVQVTAQKVVTSEPYTCITVRDIVA